MSMGTIAALVLLYVLQLLPIVRQKLTTRPTRVLVTFSTPFIQQLYFLRSSAEGGIQYGVLGFCRELTDTCTRQCVHPTCRKIRMIER